MFQIESGWSETTENYMAGSNDSYCVDLPIYNNNKTFCGITEEWKARITSKTALAAFVIPTIFAWLITLFIMFHVQKHILSIYKHSFQQFVEEKGQTKNEFLNGKPEVSKKEKLYEIDSVKSTSTDKGNKSWKTESTVTDGYSLKKNSNRNKTDNRKSEKLVIQKSDMDDEYSINARGTELTDMNDANDKIILEEDSNEAVVLKAEAADNALAEECTSGSGSSKKNINKRSSAKALNRKNWNHKRHQCCIYTKKFYLVFSIIILTNLKLLWDAIDVTIDAYLFYQLETGKVIHEHVYRNNHVNNAILAFSVLGCLKILFWLRIIGVGEDFGMKDLKTSEILTRLKLHFAEATFIFEDGPELILEYFFVEKYMSKQLIWYLFVRDIILSLISLYTIVISLLFLIPGMTRIKKRISGKYNKKRRGIIICQILVNDSCNVFIGLLLFLRAGGAGYQYVTGKLRRSCFAIDNGFLIQTPFTVGCMREVDYFIIALSGISILCSFLAFISVNCVLKKVYSPLSLIGIYC